MQTLFRIELKNVSDAISLCRRATLRLSRQKLKENALCQDFALFIECVSRVLRSYDFLPCKALNKTPSARQNHRGDANFMLVLKGSRLSFPGTEPPDPKRVSEGVSKGSLKGFRRVLEGF